MKAFPTNIKVATGGDGWRTEHGMDLRDYFAAKVMQSFIQVSASLDDENEFSFDWAVTCGVSATTSLHGEEKDGTRFKYSWARFYAEESYLVADAMMKARENKDVN
jgi:hypothetical protein